MKDCLLAVCLLGFALPGSAKNSMPLQSAKVISQKIDSFNDGARVMTMGDAMTGHPPVDASSTVVIETANSRLTLVETIHARVSWIQKRPSALVLPVNGTIQFYRDGNWLVILDPNHKKHRFEIVHEEIR